MDSSSSLHLELDYNLRIKSVQSAKKANQKDVFYCMRVFVGVI